MLTVCLTVCHAVPVMADVTLAASMRLSRTEGTVSVVNTNGKNISLIENMKLYDGYGVETQQTSYAWITLDDTKAVKMDAVSAVKIQQKGKKLELLLNAGSLFFDVKEALKEDEVLNIRTSTMVTGIRGTSGIVRVIDDKHSQITILDGQVQTFVADPVSGQMKQGVISAGQTAELYVYEQHAREISVISLSERQERKMCPGLRRSRLQKITNCSTGSNGRQTWMWMGL